MTTPLSKGQSRFVPSEEVVGTVRQWSFGAVDDWDGRLTALKLQAQAAAEPSAEEQIQRLREEAYDQGVAQAQADTAREWQMRMDDHVAGPGREAAARMAQLLARTEASLQALEQRAADQVLGLACDIARQVVRRELRADPAALAEVVREALGMLVLDARPAVVRLHPQDMEPIRAFVQAEPAQAAIQWIADATLAPGDCLVAGGGTVVDGTLAKRWSRAVASLGLPLSSEEELPDA